MVVAEEGMEGKRTEERKEEKGGGEESRRGAVWVGVGNCRVFWAGLIDEGAARVGGGGVVS